MGVYFEDLNRAGPTMSAIQHGMYNKHGLRKGKEALEKAWPGCTVDYDKWENKGYFTSNMHYVFKITDLNSKKVNLLKNKKCSLTRAAQLGGVPSAFVTLVDLAEGKIETHEEEPEGSYDFS